MTPSAIRTLRKRLKLSADQFAATLGFTSKNRALSIYRWESGKREPSQQTIILMKQLAAQSQQREK